MPASFIISYDLHNSRNYKRFYDAMYQNGGVMLSHSQWGIDYSGQSLSLHQWVQSLFDADDTIVIFEAKAGMDWCVSNIQSKRARNWLSRFVTWVS